MSKTIHPNKRAIPRTDLHLVDRMGVRIQGSVIGGDASHKAEMIKAYLRSKASRQRTA